VAKPLLHGSFGTLQIQNVASTGLPLSLPLELSWKDISLSHPLYKGENNEEVLRREREQKHNFIKLLSLVQSYLEVQSPYRLHNEIIQ
jgi:hypothetical protein